MTDWTTQRISQENVEKVRKQGTGSDFDEKLESILEVVEFYDKDLIDELVEKKVELALSKANY